MTAPRSPASSMQQLLVAHAHADRTFDALMAAAKKHDHAAVATHVRALQAEMHQHLAAEEELLFPAYAQVAPDEVEGLVAAHAEIRRALADLELSAARNEVDRKRLVDVMNLLLAHHAHEETGVYRWARARDAAPPRP